MRAANAPNTENLATDFIILLLMTDWDKAWGEGCAAEPNISALHYMCHFTLKPETVKPDNFCNT
jgi:hypothetical protein